MNQDDLYNQAEEFQAECQQLVQDISDKSPKVSVEDAINIFLFHKLAEFEIRLRQLEGGVKA
jgi:hypothetical protein